MNPKERLNYPQFLFNGLGFTLNMRQDECITHCSVDAAMRPYLALHAGRI
jgi:hypothetical protein